MAIRIVTDSAGSLPQEEADKYGITVIPISVQLDGNTYRDNIDLKNEEFYRFVENGAMPKTSAPAPGDFIEYYQPIVDRGDSIISIHMSSKASSTYQGAVSAKDFFPGATIDVIDSMVLTYIQSYIVIAAAKAAAAGASREEILKLVEDEMTRSYAYLGLPQVKFIQAGGRITKGQALLASLLSIKPVLYYYSGELIVAEKVRTFPNTLNKVLELAAEKAVGHRCECSIQHSNNLKAAEDFVEIVREKLKPENIRIGESGMVISSHTGPGTIILVVHLLD